MHRVIESNNLQDIAEQIRSLQIQEDDMIRVTIDTIPGGNRKKYSPDVERIYKQAVNEINEGNTVSNEKFMEAVQAITRPS